MRIVLTVVAFAVAAAAAAFALLNSEPVTLDLYLAQYEQPLALWLIAFLIIGVFIGLLVPVRALLRQRHRARRLDADLRRLSDPKGQGRNNRGGPPR